MKVHFDIESLPLFNNAVVTIGTFDGVHLGHRQIIEKLKAEAKAIQGETVIVTFHPHPRKVVSSAILGVRLINTLEEKIELLAQLDIDHLVVVPFTDAFANQDAEDYVQHFLVSKFRPHTIIIGYDHRFGRERQGDYLLLEKLAPVFNYTLKEIPKHVLDEISISSTRIRQALLAGELTIAERLLGYEFFFSGLVVDGDKLGRRLGYPTANLKMDDDEKIVPHNGIYAVYAELLPVATNEVASRDSINAGTAAIMNDAYHHFSNGETDKRMKGMMSIGFRPTVDGKKRVIEINLFNFSQDIYGRHLRVYVKKYLREEIKFENLEALVQQIDQDKIESQQALR